MNGGKFIRRAEIFERRKIHSAEGDFFLAAENPFGGLKNFLAAENPFGGRKFLSVTDVTDKIFRRC